MPTIASLAVEVTADTKDAQSGLSGILQTMLGFVGGQAILNGLGDVLDFVKGQVSAVASATNEQDQATAQLNSTLQSTHDISGMTYSSLVQLAEGISDVTDYSKPMVEQSEKVLLTFTDIGKNVFPQAERASVDLAARMNMDLASASLLVGKALEDPVKGMTALHRVGVDLSAAQQQQVKDFMAVNDLAGAQGVILGVLNQQMGGAAEAAGRTFGGQVQILKDKLQDLYATFGDDIEPVLGKFVSQIFPIAQQIGQAVAQIFDLGGAFKAMSDPTQIAANAVSLVGQGLTTVLGVVKQVAQGVETGTGTFGGLRDTLVDLAAFIFQQVIPAMEGLATFAKEDLLPAIESVGNFLESTVLPILGTFANVFVTDILPAVEKVASAIVTQLLPPLEKILGTVLPVLNPLLQALGWLLGNVVGPAAQLVINVLALLLTGIDDLLNATIAFVQQGIAGFEEMFTKDKQTIENFIGVVEGLISFFHALPDRMLEAGEALIEGFIHGIENEAGNLANSLKNVVGGAISDVPGLGGVLSHIPGFATGGTMPVDGLAVVGEQGPELLQLPGGTEVTPLTGSNVISGPPANMTLVSGGAANGDANGQPIQVNLYLDNTRLGMVMAQLLPTAVRSALGTGRF